MSGVDVIIPTYNRGQVLKDSLPTYWLQPETSRIFVVDDASTDGTEEIVAEIRKKSPVPVLYHRFSDNCNQQRSKNFGIENSSAPLLFIGEDDVFLPKDHFKFLLSVMNETGADIVAGRRVYIKDSQSQENALKESSLDKDGIFTRIPFEAYFERYFEGDLEVPYLHSNALIKRETFSEVRYDPSYKGNAFREELDFYLGCLRNGKKMVATSRTVCFHLKSPRKKGSGSQIRRLRYEYYVWVNTLKCFSKNVDVFKSKFNMKIPILYAILGLLARYPYALWKRIKRRS